MKNIQEDNISFQINEDSFREIYNLYWEKVFMVCYSNLRDEDLSKGMVQEIFKSIWEKKNTLEICQSVEKYLVKSAKYKVFEYIRNKKNREQHLEQIACNQVVSSNFTENDVMLNSLKERLATLIEDLPKQCRRVFKMSREQGLSNKEIALDLHISERAVEYHISKALSSLKSNLPEYSL